MLKQGSMEDEPFQQQAYSIMTKTNCSDNAVFGGRNVNIQYEVFSSVDGIVQACVYLVKTNCKGLSQIQRVFTSRYDDDDDENVMLSTGKWSHVALTIDSDGGRDDDYDVDADQRRGKELSVKVFINGICARSLIVDKNFDADSTKYSMIPDTVGEPMGTLYVGAYGKIGKPFHGCVALVKFWKGAIATNFLNENMCLTVHT